VLLAGLGALAIGLSLGLLGSGGSILTVPVLIYLLGQGEKPAIAGSLFVVGVIATAGGGQYAWRRCVDWRSVAAFGAPAMAGTWAGAWLGGKVGGGVQLTVFAAVMLLAAFLMVRPPFAERGDGYRRGLGKVMADGAGVGVLTGFVGVGGGFLIVPALVLLGGLPMSLAVGTSLVIIALKSFTGLVKYLDVLAEMGLALDWPTLVLVATVGTVGSFVGRRLGKGLPQERLKRIFAVFVVAIALFILARSLPDLL